MSSEKQIFQIREADFAFKGRTELRSLPQKHRKIEKKNDGKHGFLTH